MMGKRSLKWLLYLNLGIVLFLIGYKVYLNLSQPTFDNIHTEQLSQLQNNLSDPNRFSFAVVGNINNSVGIFEQRIVPELNQSGVDFMISAGNAVSSGGEDNYRALYGTLSHLDIPFLLTFGEKEYGEFGTFRFYEHFGPYFYNFTLGDSQFIFLDTTGKTAWRWQIEWLKGVLQQDSNGPTFLFMGHPIHEVQQPLLFEREDHYLKPAAFREALLELIHRHPVDAVFSANLPVFSRQLDRETLFITTGGAGGLVLNNETSFYHYVKVTVEDGQIHTELEPLDIGQNPILKQLESLWFFVYSLFYVSYVNFILLICALALAAIKLYQLVFVERDYYPNFDLDPTPWQNRPLRVAMFTNNYLPFIGGVPLSIERLRRGLRHLGHKVIIVAPRYRETSADEDQIVRVPTLFTLGARREFRLANIFLARIRREVRRFKPEIIHLHHPIWLGSLGLWIAHRLHVPAVYTYHTRLEHYAHFVPLPGALFRNLISHALIKHFANRCDGVIVPTNSAEEYLRMIGVKSSVFVQPTGIDFDRFQAVKPEQVRELRDQLALGDRKILVSVSRLSNEKNIDFIIDAVARLRDQNAPAFHLLMIGDGHQRKRLQKRLDDLQLNDWMSFTGSVPPDDIALYYHLGDLFVFASKSETQGMVILEAMAARVPVVAIRSSGIDDVIREGENGYKTPDNLDHWCQRVRQCLEDDSLRDTLAHNAQEFARQNSTEAFARQVQGIYAWLLAAHHQEQKELRSGEPE